jgi:pimeloyl-ACP methyl ester carboxylesterase
MSPHLRWGLRTVLNRPEFVERTATRVLGFLERHRHTAARLTMLGANPADRALLADARTRDVAMCSFLHAAAGGVRGMIDDYALCCAPWGFELASVKSYVHLWHGADDEFVPLEHARRLAEALPRCHVTIGTDDGHFFYRKRIDDVLSTVVAAARETAAPAPLLAAA